MKDCIVLNANSFEIKSYSGTSKPAYFVIEAYDGNKGLGGNTYLLAPSKVLVYWAGGKYEESYVSFSWDGTELEKFSNPSITAVCSYLQKYSSLGINELYELKQAIENAEVKALHDSITFLKTRQVELLRSVTNLLENETSLENRLNFLSGQINGTSSLGIENK